LVVGALVPVLVAALVARPALSEYFARYYTRRRESAVRFAERSIRARSDGIARLALRVCTRDPIFDRLLVGTPPAAFPSREDLASAAAELRESLGVDTLTFARPNGEIIASPHDPTRLGARDAELATLAQRSDGANAMRRARSQRGADANEPGAVVIEAICTARRGTGSLLVALGFVIDARVLGDPGDEGLTVRVVPGEPTATASAASTVRPVALDASVDRPVASIVVSTSDEPLERALHDLERVLALAAIFAAFTGLLLALVLAPRLSRPLDEVAEAADRIALGTRSVRIQDTTAIGEAGRLVHAFNRMAKNLDAAETRLRRAERVAAWRDIARQMAHEIKNPLTPIQMAVEMLRKARERNLPDFDELFDEQTRIVLEEVARLRRLVENFSRFARAPKPRPEPLQIADIVAHVASLQAGATKAEITAEVEPDLPLLRADREQLTQVLMNVVANAALAAEERSAREQPGFIAAVHVSVRNLRDGRIAIDVDDNGGGIDPSVLERLYEPYVTTRQGRGGTGLGLAITHRIVTDHSGTISAETSPEGTRFEIILPLSGPQDITLDSGDETKLPT
jgi:signal transduction histidine kinase